MNTSDKAQTKAWSKLPLFKVLIASFVTTAVLSAPCKSESQLPPFASGISHIIANDSYGLASGSSTIKTRYLLSEQHDKTMLVYQLTEDKPLLRVSIFDETPIAPVEVRNQFYQFITSLNDSIFDMLDGQQTHAFDNQQHVNNNCKKQKPQRAVTKQVQFTLI